jgi:hypothetical protein
MFINIFCYPQSARDEFLSSMKNLNIQLSLVQSSIFKVIYRDQRTSFFNLSPFSEYITNSIEYDSTIIELGSIDTSLYSTIFTFHQAVPLLYNGDSKPGIPLIGDINKNGNNEFYGLDYGDIIPEEYLETLVFESDEFDTLRLIKRYPHNTSAARNIFDIDKDGDEELHILTIYPDSSIQAFISKQSFYSKPAPESLATILNFDFVPYYNENSQLNDFTLGDFNLDGITDCAYFAFPQGYSQFTIAEYDSSKNNFDSVYAYVFHEYTSGFTIGDFDLDSKTEIVMSDMFGHIYNFENETGDNYRLIWEGSANTFNAYRQMKTNDIDKNGKPEFWVGGQFFQDNGSPIVRITCFEGVNDNQFIPVHRIDLVGVFSLFAYNLQAVDIDKDGTEEIFICIGNYILVLKFIGSLNQHQYSIYYCKIGESRIEIPVFKGAGCMNMFNQNREDMIITAGGYIQGNFVDISFIYKNDCANSVNYDYYSSLNSEFELTQNYPNPFNFSTILRLHVSDDSNDFRINVKVYNILGEVVNTLLVSELSEGEYLLVWDGTDFNGRVLSTGIYFISAETLQERQIVKTIFLK